MVRWWVPRGSPYWSSKPPAVSLEPMEASATTELMAVAAGSIASAAAELLADINVSAASGAPERVPFALLPAASGASDASRTASGSPPPPDPARGLSLAGSPLTAPLLSRSSVSGSSPSCSLGLLARLLRDDTSSSGLSRFGWRASSWYTPAWMARLVRRPGVTASTASCAMSTTTERRARRGDSSLSQCLISCSFMAFSLGTDRLALAAVSSASLRCRLRESLPESSADSRLLRERSALPAASSAFCLLEAEPSASVDAARRVLTLVAPLGGSTRLSGGFPHQPGGARRRSRNVCTCSSDVMKWRLVLPL
mmetsp:Transcript_36976/g.93366  ORF Transcript_36976/g.93366 Transcript_36976/m.93366 type:complete len:311 (+) Transcript_36976:3651-4583(+)